MDFISCPFCAGLRTTLKSTYSAEGINGEYRLYYAQCGDCLVCSPSFRSPEEVYSYWNSRPPGVRAFDGQEQPERIWPFFKQLEDKVGVLARRVDRIVEGQSPASGDSPKTDALFSALGRDIDGLASRVESLEEKTRINHSTVDNRLNTLATKTGELAGLVADIMAEDGRTIGVLTRRLDESDNKFEAASKRLDALEHAAHREGIDIDLEKVDYRLTALEKLVHQHDEPDAEHAKLHDRCNNLGEAVRNLHSDFTHKHETLAASFKSFDEWLRSVHQRSEIERGEILGKIDALKKFAHPREESAEDYLNDLNRKRDAISSTHDELSDRLNNVVRRVGQLEVTGAIIRLLVDELYGKT